MFGAIVSFIGSMSLMDSVVRPRLMICFSTENLIAATIKPNRKHFCTKPARMDNFGRARTHAHKCTRRARMGSCFKEQSPHFAAADVHAQSANARAEMFL